MKQKILLLLAVTFGILAFILTYRQIERAQAEIRNQGQAVQLISLRKAKLADEELRGDDLMMREVFRRTGDITNSNEILWAQRQMIIGQKLANAVPQDRVLLFTDIQPPARDKGFSSRAREGRRAYAVPADAVSSVNYLIQPDDRVDVIGTFTIPDYKGDSSIDMVTLTLIQNVRVLAVGSRWGATYSQLNDPTTRAYTTITLELFPNEVELVGFAAQKGRLSFSLRNFNDTRVLPNPQSVNFKSLLESLPEYTRQRGSAL